MVSSRDNQISDCGDNMETNNIINTNSSNNTTTTYLVPKAVGFETPILGTGNAARNDSGFLGGFFESIKLIATENRHFSHGLLFSLVSFISPLLSGIFRSQMQNQALSYLLPQFA